MSITGFVLAGGASSRMGRDKAWLSVGDTTLIDVVVRQLRPHVDRLILIGHAANAERLIELGADGVLIDLKPGHGPLMGLYTGLMATETPLNVFVSCDMPWIEPALLAWLTARCTDATPLVAARHPLEGMQPFPLACHVSASRLIGRLLDQGERSLKTLLRQPQAELVTVNDPALWRCFTNVNTPDDYAKLQENLALTRRF